MTCKGKRKHTSKTSAIAAAIRLSRNNTPLRTYKCPACGFWHLSSRRRFASGATAQ